MTCQSPDLTRTALEANMGLLTPATLPETYSSAHSPPPACPRLLSSGTGSPTVHDSSLLETLRTGAQIHGKLVHPDPALSDDRWVELQDHIATRDL